MSFILFFLIWVAVLTSAYWYVGRRMIRFSPLQRSGKRWMWTIVLVFLLLPLIAFMLVVSKIEMGWVDLITWIGYMSLGFFALVLTGIFSRDILLMSTRVGSWVGNLFQGRGDEHQFQQVDRERRRFLIHSTNLGILGGAALASGYGLYESHCRTTVEQVDIPLPYLPESFVGFRIVQFTDLHVGPTIKRAFVEHVVAEIAGLKPDLIAFTGDLVDGSVPWLRNHVAPLKELNAPHGKFFVTGNHEYYSGVIPWIKEANALGFDVFLNEHRILEKGGGQIVLAGVTDYGAGDFYDDQKSDPAAALTDSPMNLVKILLAHQPRSIFEAEKAGFDLQLSGHTHGGQFHPWSYLARLAQPYIRGLHRHGRSQIYVSRGIGYWGPPLRLGIPPEITVLTLMRQVESV